MKRTSILHIVSLSRPSQRLRALLLVGRVGFEPTNRVAGLIYSQLALTTCIPTHKRLEHGFKPYTHFAISDLVLPLRHRLYNGYAFIILPSSLFGAGRGTQTLDLSLTRRLLCQLSYAGISRHKRKLFKTCIL